MTLIEIADDDIFERLSDYDYQRAYRWRRNRKLENTTSWILKQSDVLAWLHGEGPQCLWLSGIGELRLSVCFRFDQILISYMRSWLRQEPYNVQSTFLIYTYC